jgi:hypothetical protein
MCPMCLSTAVLIAVSIASTGGLAAIGIRKMNAPGTITPNSNQRRNQDVNQHDGPPENSVAR